MYWMYARAVEAGVSMDISNLNLFAGGGLGSRGVGPYPNRIAQGGLGLDAPLTSPPDANCLRRSYQSGSR